MSSATPLRSRSLGRIACGLLRMPQRQLLISVNQSPDQMRQYIALDSNTG